MKKININILSSKSIKSGIKELEKYKRDTLSRFNELMQALVTQGIVNAKENISSYYMPFSNGSLENSIQGMYNGLTGTGVIFSDSNHAIFFHFGTGIIGANNPNPQAEELGYQYDVNNHGENGWVYYIDGQRHWTKGMPSRPFLTTALVQLEQQVETIAKQIFAR